LKGGERHPTAEKTLRHVPTKNDKRKTVKAVTSFTAAVWAAYPMYLLHSVPFIPF